MYFRVPSWFLKYNVSFLCISEYPHELHDLHKHYLLVHEGLQIEENILSDYQHHLLQDEGFTKPPPKLVPNLHNKRSYIIHYHILNLYLELGLRLTNVHRVLLLDQSPWLKNYINFNTHQHAAAKNGFEKDFFKLMSNTVFGKSFLFLSLFAFTYWFIHCFLFIAGKVLSLFLLVIMYLFLHRFFNCR